MTQVIQVTRCTKAVNVFLHYDTNQLTGGSSCRTPTHRPESESERYLTRSVVYELYQTPPLSTRVVPPPVVRRDHEVHPSLSSSRRCCSFRASCLYTHPPSRVRRGISLWDTQDRTVHRCPRRCPSFPLPRFAQSLIVDYSLNSTLLSTQTSPAPSISTSPPSTSITTSRWVPVGMDTWVPSYLGEGNSTRASIHRPPILSAFR